MLWWQHNFNNIQSTSKYNCFMASSTVVTSCRSVSWWQHTT